MRGKPKFEVGDELVGPVRAITTQRIEWYDSAMLSAATDVLTIPASVLTRKDRDGSYMVPVWNEGAKASQPKKVTVGLNNNVVAEVTSGLEEGDLIVVSSAAAGGGATAAAGGGPPGAFLGGGGFGGPPRF